MIDLEEGKLMNFLKYMLTKGNTNNWLEALLVFLPYLECWAQRCSYEDSSKSTAD